MPEPKPGVIHPNEHGPRMLFGKPYYWDVDSTGKRTLKPWPNDPDGIPVAYEHLEREQ